jgi:ketosteroid isomerase-like protein
MRSPLFTALICCLVCVPSARAAEDSASLAQQVRSAETAFAQSMARRDLDAFARLLAPDAVFFGEGVLRGKDEVVAGWKGFFDGASAPFSWSSASVEVLASGTLAHSSGPVMDKNGNQIGTFNSIWRREADGSWKVVFDKGCDACRCGTQQGRN